MPYTKADLLKALEEHRKQTIFVYDSSSECGSCGKGCSYEDKAHIKAYGWGTQDEKGCGVEWKFISSGYEDIHKNLHKMRPDLIVKPFFPEMEALDKKG